MSDKKEHKKDTKNEVRKTKRVNYELMLIDYVISNITNYLIAMIIMNGFQLKAKLVIVIFSKNKK